MQGGLVGFINFRSFQDPTKLSIRKTETEKQDNVIIMDLSNYLYFAMIKLH